MLDNSVDNSNDIKPTERAIPQSGWEYTHYKGLQYVVLATGRMEATGDLQVVYQCNKTQNVWIRPVEEFLAQVEVDGELMWRFV